MEIAFNELRNTVDIARTYSTDEDVLQNPAILRSHVRDIQEDINFLDKHKNSYKDREQDALELIVEARRLKRDLERMAYDLEVLAKQQEQPAALPGPSRSSSVKLPRIKLPTFDGETSADYRGFMDAFNDSLSVEPDLSEVKKWLLLRAQLTGRAYSLVKELPTAPETYKVAVQILEDSYGSTKRAILKLYERVQNLPRAAMDTESLRTTYAQLEGVLLSLSNLGEQVDSNCFLRAVVLGKYPNELIHLLRVTDEMPLSAFRTEMSAYVKQRDCIFQQPVVSAARVEQTGGGSKGGALGVQQKKPRHGTATSSNGGGSGTPAPPDQVNVTVKNNATSKKREPKAPCVFCSGSHWSDECGKVTAIDERLALTADRCQRCLRPAHVDDTCKSRRSCFYCRDSAHNSALCPKQFAKVLLARDGGAPTRFVTAVLPVGNVSRTKQAEARVILDTAGGRSLITATLASQLELEPQPGCRVRFIGVNRVPLAGEPSTARRLMLFPPGASPIEIEVYVVPEIVDGVAATSVSEIKRQFPRYSSLTMPREGNGEDVALLLGYRALTSIVTLSRSISLSPTLQLLSTRFGWIPFGGLPEKDESVLDSTVIGLLREEDPVRLMSDLELIGLADFLKTENEEEALVLDKFYGTIKRVEARYEVEWPYRSSNPEIDDNFGLAFGRLASLQKQLAKNPALLDTYDRLIKAQLEDGVVELVNLRAVTRANLTHYLPHRAVVRANKSTPVRMVFDAAARCGKSARSLNDLIMKGGNWVNDIPGVLARFRRYSVSVTADIVKAFHQISIAPKDRDVVRFLWLRNPLKPPSKENVVVYRFRRMAFGVVASPFLLTATIRYHLRENPNKFGDVIERDMYADNLITSLPSTVNAAEFYATVTQCFGGMSMDLSQWTTDSGDMRAVLERQQGVGEPTQSVLGLEWNTVTKTLRIRSPRLAVVDGLIPTKRIVLRELATVYDPLGWMSPVTLSARLFLRDVWNAKYEWEKPLAPEMATKWRELRLQLNRVAEISFPRPYGFGGLENAEKCELHAFCDASGVAYGVVIYLCVHEKERSWSGIVAAKSRLAPKTKISIPRLELLAAVAACRFLIFTERALQLKEATTKYLWSDAKCVINWANSEKILPVFVEKSVKTIRASNLTKFQYVPTTQNPADASSRGATVEELRDTHWWDGPAWLLQSASWPNKQLTCEENEKELAQIEKDEAEEERVLLFRQTIRLRRLADPQINENSPFELNPNDFSSLARLIRITALCVRAAASFLRGRGTIRRTPQPDYRDARCRWFRWDQQRTYEASENEKTNAAYLKNLKVSTDQDGLMRCETRIKRADLPRNTTQPILLVKKSALTKLLILSIHSNNYHVGTAQTLATLRKRYWLPHGRREVYQTLKQCCHTCRRSEAEPFRAPEMSDLPLFRITETDTPFQNVGLDLFGPFKIREGRSLDGPKFKRWVLIFTCLVIRAVHLEVLRDMTAEEFLNSLRRFVGRRGVPKILVSDNQPEFYVVERIFQCVWRRFATADKAERYYAQHDIQWKYIPPHAPWMGGAYERLIREVKKAFHKVYGQLVLQEDQFQIAIIEIEGVVNSRPITYVDKEEETEIITPNDFLRVRYPALPTDFTRPVSDAALVSTWRAADEYIDQFWKLWSESYLMELRERREIMRGGQRDVNRPPQVGEMVLMVEPTRKRSKWRLAVIERLIQSEDGRVRSAQIRSGDRSRMIRPITQLASLKVFMDPPEEVGQLVDHGRAIVVDETSGAVEL